MNLFLPNGAIHAVPNETKELPDLSAVPQTDSYDYKEEAFEAAIECWTDEETKGIPLDSRLAAAVASRIAGWMQIAAQGYRGAEFYRGIIDQCGQAIGIEAYTSDDGSVQQDVLALKLPELVKQLIPEGERASRLASVPVEESKPSEPEAL